MKSIILALLIVGCIACNKSSSEDDWKPLFNGENLDGWTMKFSGSQINENYLNTFRVEDSILKVSYDEYEIFENRYGHLFYNTPYSHYRLRLEYRFTGEKLPDSPWWTAYNSGVMIHSQAPDTMPLIPDPTDDEVEFLAHFPVSVECQLLGNATTANISQIGTFVDLNGQKAEERNVNSNSKVYPPGEWVKMEIVVLGDSIAHHIVEGDTVLTYTNIRYADTGKPLSEGYIAIQAESQPVDFRKIEILELADDQ